VKVPSTPGDIAAALKDAPTCERIVFETGRMAPMLYHGLSRLGLPIFCIESRQAYQALKSLATHKTDRNDARGLAHLARTGFFKPVHVKSLPAHALRSLIIAREKLVGQRITLENQIRGLAVVFGVRLPRALTGAFVRQALRASEGITGLSAAGYQTTGEGLRRLPPADDDPGCRSAHRTCLHRCNRRSRPLQAIP
jgi:transposase